jgi:UDP-2-acetamido-3-amino-2,3-dideoxy-glucuronate N-acetyltransferase
MPAHFQHPQSLVETDAIGPGTRIWAFAHVLPGAVIGKDCNICDHVFIENRVRVGDRVTVKCGVQLWDGVTIEDDVFIGPNVTFTNDRFPRSRQHLADYPETLVRKGASIGANATILPGITIGQSAMIGAGAVVTRSVPPYAVVVGNPAQIQRYVSNGKERARSSTPATSGTDPEVEVLGVQLIRAPMVRDLRGNLIAREIGHGLPFAPERFFVISDVPTKEVRGEHAHRRCAQLLVCLAGAVVVVCDDGRARQEFVLDDRELGLYLPPMVWGTQYRYTKDAVLLVLASRVYEPEDYIRDYDEFMIERRKLDANA